MKGVPVHLSQNKGGRLLSNALLPVSASASQTFNFSVIFTGISSLLNVLWGTEFDFRRLDDVFFVKMRDLKNGVRMAVAIF